MRWKPAANAALRRAAPALTACALMASCGGSSRQSGPARPAISEAARLDRAQLAALRARPDRGAIIGSDGPRSATVILTPPQPDPGGPAGVTPLDVTAGGTRTPPDRGPRRGPPPPPQQTPARARARMAVALALGRPLGEALPLHIRVAASPAELAVAALAARLGTAARALVAADVSADGRLRPLPAAELREALASSRSPGEIPAVIVAAGEAAALRGRFGQGSRVIPARTLTEAYRAATGAALPQTEAPALPDLSSAVADATKQSVDSLRTELARDYATVVRMNAAGRLAPALRRRVDAAMRAVRRAEMAAGRGQTMRAWRQMSRARRHGGAAALVARVLERIRAGDGEAGHAELDAATEELLQRLARIEATPDGGLEGQLRAAEIEAARQRAAMDAKRVQAWRPDFEQYLKNLSASDSDPYESQWVDEIVERLDLVAGAIARSHRALDEADRLGELRVSSLLPVAADERLREVAGLLRAARPVGDVGPAPVDTRPASAVAGQGQPREGEAEAEAEAAGTPPVSPVADAGWPAAARAALAAPIEAPAGGTALAQLGHALAAAQTAKKAAPSAAELAVARDQARRMVHRATLVLGGAPRAVLWRLALVEAMSVRSPTQRRVVLEELERATLVAAIAVELALAGAAAPLSETP